MSNAIFLSTLIVAGLCAAALARRAFAAGVLTALIAGFLLMLHLESDTSIYLLAFAALPLLRTRASGSQDSAEEQAEFNPYGALKTIVSIVIAAGAALAVYRYLPVYEVTIEKTEIEIGSTLVDIGRVTARRLMFGGALVIIIAALVALYERGREGKE